MVLEGEKNVPNRNSVKGEIRHEEEGKINPERRRSGFAGRPALPLEGRSAATGVALALRRGGS